MFWYGQRTITGVYRSIFPVTGYRIWNATKTARTTSLSHTAQLRHGIEWARLITQWALSTYKEDKAGAAPYIEAAENLYNRAVADAWNADGAPGICYTTDWNGKPVVHDRMHWTLAEAINTSSVLFHVTDNEKYAADYAEFMKYLDEKVLDHVNGSWFHQLDRENNLLETVWPGKSDIYHALQATLIPYYAPGLSIAVAVKKQAR